MFDLWKFPKNFMKDFYEVLIKLEYHEIMKPKTEMKINLPSGEADTFLL